MARPKTRQLTERELEVMHVFWEDGPLTAHQVRDRLESAGRPLAYTTVATLIRILVEKEFVRPQNDERPYVYKPLRSFQDVSGRLIHDLVQRVFNGSREALLVRLMEGRKLTKREREALEEILDDKK